MEYFEPHELKKVLASADEHSAFAGAMFRIQFGHALRTAEVRTLTLEDVRNGKVVCERGKGSSKTIEVLRADEQAALNRWLSERKDEGSCFVFTTRLGSAMTNRGVEKLFAKVAEAAGIEPERRHPHVLKHTYASTMIRNGVDLAYVQVACGHKHISSTVRYTHVTVPEAQEKSNQVLEKVLS